MTASSSARLLIGIVAVVSFALHFIGLSHPAEVVFDETHFGGFASNYLKGDYFLLLHPPLAQLMIAGVAKLGGFDPAAYSFSAIRAAYPDSSYLWLRLLPALFGSLLAPLIVLITLRLARSLRAATIAGAAVLFENALLVQSKLILIDSFFLLFGFLAFYLFLESRAFFAEGRWGWGAVAGSALFAGFAFSVKWAGMGFWGLILLLGFFILVRKMRVSRAAGARPMAGRLRTLGAYLALLAFPPLVYTSFFLLHFRLLPNPGPGDGFMSERFLASREAGYPLKDFFLNFGELNYATFKGNILLDAKHDYGSKWYTWPFMLRPVYYWNKELGAAGAAGYEKIYLLGNPVVWWFSTFSVAIVVLQLFCARVLRCGRPRLPDAPPSVRDKRERMLGMLTLGYAVNFFPFAFVGRVAFLYHYLAALLFAVMIMSVWCSAFMTRKRTLVGFLVLIVLGFLVIMPLTYGLPLDRPWPRSLFWFKSWI